MSTTKSGGDGHSAGCCADIFGSGSNAAPALSEDQAAGNAGDAQKAFAAFMRSVQAGGAVSEKAKELILFALVLQSRCKPCFAAHFERAAELGITRAELDEAAWCAIAMGGAPVRMFYQECLKAAGDDRK